MQALPRKLPEGAMVVLTDEIPPLDPDAAAVAAELSRLPCRALLLDFQRPGHMPTARLAAAIAEACPFPVAVAEPYARGLDCPVFLPPVPPDLPVEEALSPWWGREIWLDLAPSPTRITVTAEGSRREAVAAIPAKGQIHREPELRCHYQIQTGPEAIRFTLWRDRQDLRALMAAAEPLGATLAVAFYREWWGLSPVWPPAVELFRSFVHV